MDYHHQLITSVLQATLTLLGSSLLAILGYKLNQKAKAVAPAPTGTPVAPGVPVGATGADPDAARVLAWKDRRIKELEHQIDRERQNHNEELASRNRLISDLRDEMVLARRWQPMGQPDTPAQKEAFRRSEGSRKAVAGDSGAGDGGQEGDDTTHGYRDR